MMDPLHTHISVADNVEVEAEPLAEEEAQAPAVAVAVSSSSCPWRDGLARTCGLAFFIGS